MKNANRQKDAAARKAPHALVWLVLGSSLCGAAQPVTTTPCVNGERIIALEFVVGAYHVVTSAFRCNP